MLVVAGRGVPRFGVTYRPEEFDMSRRAFNVQDLREFPAYSIVEAAGYLRLPVSTLRAWLLGQRYRAGDEPKFFRPVIEIADRKDRQLSFINLVESFVLAGIRRQHEIPLPKVRKAVDYLRRTFNSNRPLAEEQFQTDGVDLFVEKMGSLIGATQEGQIQMREVIRDRLQRVLRDPKGVPEKIVLFPARGDKPRSTDVVIDPKLSFGRPVLDGFGVRTAILAERFDAGEDINALAEEYSAPVEAIQNAIRCERRVA
ncbi:MAG TPA: DUF433 domain-containing protein [Burkholderiales bacterium]|nr:DUF433 domain-containing protein [Burkholderiales bacterium]